MGVFKDVTLNWNGVDYAIPSNRVMGAIEEIEDVLPLKELMRMQGSGSPSLSKISRAFAAVINYAAAQHTPPLPRVQQEDVYQGMFSGSQSQTNIASSLTTLLMMMVPPSVIEEAAAAKPGNVRPPRRARRAAGSSKRHSK